MKDDRLNHLSILSYYKDEIDAIDIIKVANQFAIKDIKKLTIFKNFTERT